MPAQHHIKRYANRKLYDTTTKRYVTLDDLAELVQQGAVVEVLDNETGEDITSVTLTQILYEREKRREGILPGNLLHALIKAPSGPLRAGLQRVLAGGLGVAKALEREGERWLAQLEQQAESAPPPDGGSSAEGSAPLDGPPPAPAEAASLRAWIGQAIEQQMTAASSALGLVTQEQVTALTEAVEQLAARLSAMEHAAARAAETHASGPHGAN